MLIKARGVAGDGTLAAEFLEMIQPFRYPRSINESVLREVVAMKSRIENESAQGGRTGAQREARARRHSRDRVRGAGAAVAARRAATVPARRPNAARAWPSWSNTSCSRRTNRDSLARPIAFCATWSIACRWRTTCRRTPFPTDRRAQERLARLMGFATPKEFEAARRAHTQQRAPHLRPAAEGAMRATARRRRRSRASSRGRSRNGRSCWPNTPSRIRTRPSACCRSLSKGPGYVHVSPRTSELARQLLPRLFALCPQPEAAGVQRRPPRPRTARDALGKRAAFRSGPGGDAARQLHQRLRGAGDALRALAQQPLALRAAGAAVRPLGVPGGDWPFARRTWWTSW